VEWLKPITMILLKACLNEPMTPCIKVNKVAGIVCVVSQSLNIVLVLVDLLYEDNFIVID
jgi:hypothetical protein